MTTYQQGNPLMFEVLAIEFVKNLDKLDLQKKATALRLFAQVDIDASTILRTAHTVCSSTLEALRLQTEADEAGLTLEEGPK
mmetsp:Transcript_19801/g.30531  ORF Transcript_19801/g.30531 Transcript_19801/m.30531 type:complete len:82 (-) Transcript_19801:237-482(-)